MNLTPLVQSFVLHFGEMGSRWGINRTVGQIYALLYASEKPLNAEDIAEALAFSRSNVSMGLKELDSWYFSTPEDVWIIFRTLVDERRKREVDPTLSMLRDAMLIEPDHPQDRYAQKRMGNMYELIELMTDWLKDIQHLDEKTLRQLMKLGAAAQKVLEFKGKIGIGTSS
jgi:DNA-binding transcriptional regulator GbsR (MarR family)